MTLRRVLILADESAEWMVAGLRQLERLALSVDEFAIENKETAPVLVCIFWRPDLDELQRWVPTHNRLTMVAFTTALDGEPFDLILNTRLFLYRKAIRPLISEGRASARPITSEQAFFDIGDVRKHVPPSEEDLWKSHFRSVELVPHFREGAWEYITDGNQIDEIEVRFLRGSGKPQDGFVSRYLNRPISRVVTRLLLRFPTTPNAWTLFIFPIPVIASLSLLHGSYWSFLWSLVLFQVFSVLDGCDGELARAKFLESERGRQLDDLFDILSNILLVVGLGFGLSRPTNLGGRAVWLYVVEGLIAGVLIGVNEFYLATRRSTGVSPVGPAGILRAVLSATSTGETPVVPTGKMPVLRRVDKDEAELESLGGALYSRHREMVERSGMLFFGEKFASWLIQLTKRDVAVLFFVFLAAIGQPALILHLLFTVTTASLILAWRARSTL